MCHCPPANDVRPLFRQDELAHGGFEHGREAMTNVDNIRKAGEQARFQPSGKESGCRSSRPGLELADGAKSALFRV